MHISRLATLSLFVSGLAVCLLVVGPSLTLLRLVAPMTGFYAFLAAGAVGTLGLALGLVGCLMTRPTSPRAGRARAVKASLLGVSCVAVIALAAVPSRELPPINDITTDTQNPPRFVALLEIDTNAGRDMSYPGREFTRAQRAAYPDLDTLHFDDDRFALFRRVEATIRAMGWETHAVDAERGHIEASDHTWIFGFVDDVVIRIHPDGDGSRLDMRSKSRDGLGDLGANAARIRQLRDALND